MAITRVFLFWIHLTLAQYKLARLARLVCTHFKISKCVKKKHFFLGFNKYVPPKAPHVFVTDGRGDLGQTNSNGTMIFISLALCWASLGALYASSSSVLRLHLHLAISTEYGDLYLRDPSMTKISKRNEGAPKEYLCQDRIGDILRNRRPG